MTKRNKIIIIVAAIALFVIGAGVFIGVVFFSPMSDPLYVAHRGYSKTNPDNTPLSFAAAANKGFWGIETDIRFTKDGIPVCAHDADVKFEDGTSLVIAENTYAALREKPLKNTKTADKVYLCPFEEYLTACANGDKVAVIELKTICSADELVLLLTKVDALHSRAKSAFIAFDYENLTALRMADESLALQYLSETKNDPRFEDCLKDGISIDVKYNVATKALVKKFHKNGLKVNVWTINTDWRRGEMRRLGVDFITSDVYYKN